MKKILFIFLVLALYASMEVGSKAEYDLRSVDRYQQEKPPAQASHTLVRDAGGVEVEDSSTGDNDRVIEQRGDDEDANGGDDDEADDNGDANGNGGGFDRLWDVAEFG